MSGVSDLSRGARTAHIVAYLRTQHVHYLEFLAEQLGVSLSGAFGSVIEKHGAIVLTSYLPPRKETKHFRIEPRHAELISRIAMRQGLPKADIARRLIEEAMAQDEVVGG